MHSLLAAVLSLLLASGEKSGKILSYVGKNLFSGSPLPCTRHMTIAYRLVGIYKTTADVKVIGLVQHVQQGKLLEGT